LRATQSRTSQQRRQNCGGESAFYLSGRYRDNRGARLALGEIHGSKGIYDELIRDVSAKIEGRGCARLKEGHNGYESRRAARINLAEQP
jgi:hypothetical protein